MDINALTQEAEELLARMICIPSFSREEKDVADLLEHFMADHDLHPHRHGHNLWCIHPDFEEGRPTLLLNAHIDTVRPASSWTRDPFRPTHEGDRIYGLGTNDDGASVVTLLQTFCTSCRRKISYNLIFLASCEEEVSGKNGIESVLPLLPPIDVALVGEPTGMQPAIAEKGLMVLDVSAHGKSGHAARNEGENAIYKALRDIEWFRTYRFPETSPLLGDVKMSVTMIHAGTQHNVVPDLCTFTVDVRSNENYANEEIYRTVCAHIGSEVQARSFRLNSSRIDERHPLVVRARALGRVPFGS
ncbi:MAG: M20/M25/M40 family metallo-hydrolase, partial [Paraprevotella sp.]|nr:M20/M25/M40 family metallo-hydrolase [Paraprevotella sp.]